MMTSYAVSDLLFTASVTVDVNYRMFKEEYHTREVWFLWKVGDMYNDIFEIKNF